ncbi:unnamed protein product [Caenorhabditis angaria]|uniref:Uncharacterized protein n=1 Tax=Caenorhabditis angaria TaxID=860376 RepID=A0A9P1I7R0_9PELO|nr:unnamed protein product [Caenorhabditis angaria]
MINNFPLLSACVIILAAVFPRGTDAFFCVDSAKGWCETNDMWGYCMLNKTVGSWQCDSGETCGKKDAIKNRKVNGCTKDLCCCNTGDGCSLAFIKLAEEHGQKCLNQNEAPNSDPEHFRDCDDPYCYSFLVSEEEGGQTTASRGCYHRSLLKHQMFLKEDKNYQNNTKWKETERLFSIPTCQEILSQTEKSAGNSNSSSVSQCVDFSWEQLEDPEDPTSDQIPMKGRLCCCEGGALCNSNHGWADNGVSLPELQQMIQDSKSNSTPFATSSTTVLFVFFLACTFKFF